jgi:hypothetical protein
MSSLTKGRMANYCPLVRFTETHVALARTVAGACERTSLEE